MKDTQEAWATFDEARMREELDACKAKLARVEAATVALTSYIHDGLDADHLSADQRWHLEGLADDVDAALADSGETDAENGCEHGDHPAPARKRFCSEACLRCEHESKSETGCDGICGRADNVGKS